MLVRAELVVDLDSEHCSVDDGGIFPRAYVWSHLYDQERSRGPHQVSCIIRHHPSLASLAVGTRVSEPNIPGKTTLAIPFNVLHSSNHPVPRVSGQGIVGSL